MFVLPLGAALTLAFLYFVGNGFAHVAIPRWMTRSAPGVLTSIVSGYVFLQILLAWIVGLNAPVVSAIAIGAAAAIVFTVLRARVEQVSPAHNEPVHLRCIAVVVLLACGGLSVLGISGRDAVLRVRLGVDEFGYLQAARFLATGGTLRSAAQLATRNAGDVPLSTALERLGSFINFTDFMSVLYTLRALRWGVSGFVAVISNLTFAEHVVQSTAIVLIVYEVLLATVVLATVREKLRAPLWVSLGVAAATCLNVNLLNAWFEGGWGVVATAPLLVVALVQVDRVAGSRHAWRDWRIVVASSVPAAACIAAALPQYSEAVIVWAVVCALWSALHFAADRRRGLRAALTAGLALAAGMVAVAPFTFRWVGALATRFGDVDSAGWQQPVWARPAEVLGFADIYAGVRDWAEHPRGTTLDIVTWLGSVAILALAYRAARHDWRRWAMWIAVATFPLLVFIRSCGLRGTSYQYMRAYCIVLPMLVIGFVQSLLDIGSGVARKQLGTALVLAACVYMVVNGLRSVSRFERESLVFGPQYIVQQPCNSCPKLGDYVWVTDLREGGPRSFALAMYFNMLWLNGPNLGGAYLAEFLTADTNRNIGIVYYRKSRLGVPLPLPPFDDPVLYSSDDLVLRATSLKVQDVLGANGKPDWSTLSGLF